MEQQPIENNEPGAEGYKVRPAWQVWGARIGLVIVIIAVILYYYNIGWGGR